MENFKIILRMALEWNGSEMGTVIKVSIGKASLLVWVSITGVAEPSMLDISKMDLGTEKENGISKIVPTTGNIKMIRSTGTGSTTGRMELIF